MIDPLTVTLDLIAMTIERVLMIYLMSMAASKSGILS